MNAMRNIYTGIRPPENSEYFDREKTLKGLSNIKFNNIEFKRLLALLITNMLS